MAGLSRGIQTRGLCSPECCCVLSAVVTAGNCVCLPAGMKQRDASHHMPLVLPLLPRRSSLDRESGFCLLQKDM